MSEDISTLENTLVKRRRRRVRHQRRKRAHDKSAYKSADGRKMLGLSSGSQRQQVLHQGSMKVYPLRLLPGMEIKSNLLDFVKSNGLNAAFVLTCCGSITKATLRFATGADNSHTIETLNRNFEITSLVGTVSKDGAHLHITLGDSEGATVSGHVVGGLVVHTTAEIVLGDICGVTFRREHDNATGWTELLIASDKAES